jgi:hypothetical protein
MPIRTFSCAKLMVIIVFLEKKVCEKEKKSIILSNKDYVYALRVLKK